MLCGLFYALSIPQPWTCNAERIVYPQAMEQGARTDALGFDQGWAVEHHFLEAYAHCAAPALFFTACAMLPAHLCVRHGMIICVPEFHYPIKSTKRTAVLDLLCGARLEMDTRRSATCTTHGGFQAHPDPTKESWDESVRCLPTMWTTVMHPTLQSRLSCPNEGEDHAPCR